MFSKIHYDEEVAFRYYMNLVPGLRQNATPGMSPLTNVSLSTTALLIGCPVREPTPHYISGRRFPCLRSRAESSEGRLKPYDRYEAYCKNLGLMAASQEDYENTLNTFFRMPKKYGIPWDEYNSLPVLTWRKELGRPEKKKAGESKDGTKLRTALNRAFRDVDTDAIVKFRNFSHRHLLKPQSGTDHNVARERGHDPNTPFVLDEINNWLLSLDKPGLRPMMTGQGSFWDGWDCDAWLTQEYGATYSVFLATQHTSVTCRQFLSAKEKWQSDYHSRRSHRLFRTAVERCMVKALRRCETTTAYWEGPYKETSQFLSRKPRADDNLIRGMVQKIVEVREETQGNCWLTRIAYRGTTPETPKNGISVLGLYRGSEFANEYNSMRLGYRYDVTRHGRFILGHVTGTQKRSIHFITIEIVDMLLGFVPDDNVSLRLYQSSALRCIGVLPYRPEWNNEEERSRHTFFGACSKTTFPVPFRPRIKKRLYLTLQKRWRNGGPYPDSGQLYIGRVITERDRTRDETTEQWTNLSMMRAERFVVANLRDAKFGSKEWLAWTVRYYALKEKPLPIIPDGLDEGTAWECDGDGKYVHQLVGENGKHCLQQVGEVCEDFGTPFGPLAESRDDVESYSPTEKWSGD